MTFYILAALILVFAVLVVTARSTVHGILFLVADFLAVALLYAAMNSLFVAAIQVLVYAGGIVVLYLFVVMLVRRGPEAARVPGRQNALGLFLSAAVLVELASLGVWAALRPAPASGVTGNAGAIEAVGTALYADYLVPFEVASMLLLVAMVGAILLARREL
ncbi:MAG: NADH-quinone oxidoreductase subunit J [Vicinamibacterales bacterium]